MHQARLLRGQGRLPLVWVAAQICLGFVLSQIVVQSTNRLAENGEWVPTKTTLERGVMGADQYFHGNQALAGRRLSLGAWHGYQEVIYREPLDPVEIRCQLVLHAKAYAVVVFNKTAAGFSGVRISLDPAHPSMLFTASALGEFLERTPLATPASEPKARHQLALALGKDEVGITLDGQLLGRFPLRLAVPQQIGFRGGGRMAIVDDVAIRKRGSVATLEPEATTYDSFDPPSMWPAALLCAALVMAVNAALVRLALSRAALEPRRALLGAVVANATLAVLALGGLAVVRLWATRYPVADEALRAGERTWTLSEADEVRATIRRLYPGPAPRGSQRILLLGSSQTWGSGAARQDETIAAWLERMLNERAQPGRRYQCVNGGISARDSSFLLGLYEREWIALRPRLLLVNLSNNDRDMRGFRANLRRLAQINRAAGIATAFVLEANSGEERPLARQELAAHHAVMREAAALEQVPLVDMHAWLLQNQDRGFLFWDTVHLTSFGQKLVAQRLVPEVLRLLE